MRPASVADRSPARSPEARLQQATAQLIRAWVRQAREEGRTLGLSLPQLFLLGGLRDAGRIPVTRWVEMIGVSPSATTSLLDGLEGAGYVQRTHDREDRRQVLISLTTEGHRLADRFQAKFAREWRVLCEGIPPRDLDTAAATLERIGGRMGASGHPLLTTPRAPPKRRRAP
jgi:DNA-binding MarR family transcriptional regulator